jgi:hypothetical protein
MMKSTADCLTNELLIQQLLIPLACHQVTICAQQFQAAYSLISQPAEICLRVKVCWVPFGEWWQRGNLSGFSPK